MDMRLSKLYFSNNELRCKCSCGGLKLDHVFDKMLLELRLDFSQAMHVNSCCRCKKHNTSVGGNAHSFHVFDRPFYPTQGTCAIDIDRKDAQYNDKLALTAWKHGWSIGVHPKFIHLDCRAFVTDLPQNVFSYAGATTEADLKHFKDLVK